MLTVSTPICCGAGLQYSAKSEQFSAEQTALFDEAVSADIAAIEEQLAALQATLSRLTADIAAGQHVLPGRLLSNCIARTFNSETTVKHAARLMGHLVLLCLLPSVCFSQPEPAKADWTMLVYVNGKNNLEGAAISDFYEMAEIGSTPEVNVVAQVGRPRRHYSTTEGGWSGVYRFHVKKKMKPRPEFAVVDLKRAGLNTDMASAETLEDFVRWGTKTYPAKRTMLVIWNHGQGWRFMLSKDPAVQAMAAKELRTQSEAQRLTGIRSAPSVTAGHRAVSSDDDTGGILYNRQIQDTLAKLSAHGIKIDVVGFDACLMSMVETAFALRKVATHMVASEELEPNNGWNYRTLLRTVMARSNIDAAELARTIVKSYKEHYEDGDRTTLSALDLSQVDALARSLSVLAEHLLKNLAVQRQYVAAARAGLRAFAEWEQPPLRTSIDLTLFLERLKTGNPDAVVKSKADDSLALLRRVVVANYRAAPVVDDGYGGNGLAIYYPENKAVFAADRFGSGYLPGNKLHPLEFVTSPLTSGWSRLVLKMLE